MWMFVVLKIIWLSLFAFLCLSSSYCTDEEPTALQIESSSYYKKKSAEWQMALDASGKKLSQELTEAIAAKEKAEEEIGKANETLNSIKGSSSADRAAAEDDKKKAEESLKKANEKIRNIEKQLARGLGNLVKDAPSDEHSKDFFAFSYPKVALTDNGDIRIDVVVADAVKESSGEGGEEESDGTVSVDKSQADNGFSVFYVIARTPGRFEKSAEIEEASKKATRFSGFSGQLAQGIISSVTKGVIKRVLVPASNLVSVVDGGPIYVYLVGKGSDGKYTSQAYTYLIKGVKSVVKSQGFVPGYPYALASLDLGTSVEVRYILNPEELGLMANGEDLSIFFAAYEAQTAAATRRVVTSKMVHEAVIGKGTSAQSIGGIAPTVTQRSVIKKDDLSILHRIKLSGFKIDTKYVVYAGLGKGIIAGEAVIIDSVAASFEIDTTISPAFDERLRVPRAFPLIEKISETRFRIYASSEHPTAKVHYVVLQGSDTVGDIITERIVVASTKGFSESDKLTDMQVTQGSFDVVRARERDVAELDEDGDRPLVYDPEDGDKPGSYQIQIPKQDADPDQRAKLSFADVTGLTPGTDYKVYIAITSIDGDVIAKDFKIRFLRTPGHRAPTDDVVDGAEGMVGFELTSLRASGSKVTVIMHAPQRNGIATCIAVPSLALGPFNPAAPGTGQASKYATQNFALSRSADLSLLHKEYGHYVNIRHKRVNAAGTEDQELAIAVLDSKQVSLQRGSLSSVELETGFVYGASPSPTPATNHLGSASESVTVFCSFHESGSRFEFVAAPKEVKVPGAEVASYNAGLGSVRAFSQIPGSITVTSAPVSSSPSGSSTGGSPNDSGYCAVFAGEASAKLPSAFVKRIAQASLYSNAYPGSSFRFSSLLKDLGIIYATDSNTNAAADRGPSLAVSPLVGNNMEAYPLALPPSISRATASIRAQNFSTTVKGRKLDGSNAGVLPSAPSSQAGFGIMIKDAMLTNLPNYNPLVTAQCATLKGDGSHYSRYAATSGPVSMEVNADIGSALAGFSINILSPSDVTVANGGVPGRKGPAIEYSAQGGDILIGYRTTSDVPIGCVVVDSRDVPFINVIMVPSRVNLARAVGGGLSASPSIAHTVPIPLLPDTPAARLIELVPSDASSTIPSIKIPIAGGASDIVPIGTTAVDLMSPAYRRGRILYRPTLSDVLAGGGQFIIRTGVSSIAGRAVVFCSLFKGFNSTNVESTSASDIGGSADIIVSTGSGVTKGPAITLEQSRGLLLKSSAGRLFNVSMGAGWAIQDGGGNTLTQVLEPVQVASTDLSQSLRQALGRQESGSAKAVAIPHAGNGGAGVMKIRLGDRSALVTEGYTSLLGSIGNNAVPMTCVIGAGSIVNLKSRFGPLDSEVSIHYPSPYSVFSAAYDNSVDGVNLANLRKIGMVAPARVGGISSSRLATDADHGGFGIVRIVIEDISAQGEVNFDIAPSTAFVGLVDIHGLCTFGTPGLLSPLYFISTTISANLSN